MIGKRVKRVCLLVEICFDNKKVVSSENMMKVKVFESRSFWKSSAVWNTDSKVLADNKRNI